MNTAMARRLALGDRVVWIGKDYEPSGPGTITRITVRRPARWPRPASIDRSLERPAKHEKDQHEHNADVGFVGAGVIVRSEKGHHVHRLTTAGCVWVTACVGAA